MDVSAWFALGALFATGLAYAVGATAYVSNKDAGLREKLASADTALRDKIEAVEKTARLFTEVAVEKEAKLRHDLGSNTSEAINVVHQEVKEVEKRLNDLSTDVVRKPDLQAHEARMTTILEKLDAKVDELRDRVSAHA